MPRKTATEVAAALKAKAAEHTARARQVELRPMLRAEQFLRDRAAELSEKDAALLVSMADQIGDYCRG